MATVAYPSGMDRAERLETFTLAEDRAMATSSVRASRSLAAISSEV